MTMQLLVAQWSSACKRAEDMWRQVAEARGLVLEVVDIESAPGRELTRRLQLATIPVLLIDGRPVAVGVQSEAEAQAIMDAAQGESSNRPLKH
jgi:thioredoxin-like negative regulator of GroEL